MKHDKRRPPAKPLRVSTVFQLNLKTKYPPTDSDFQTQCPACGEKQTFYECSLKADKDATLYHCRGCDDLLIVVCDWPSQKWTGPGYRLKDYCIHSKGDFTLRQKHFTAPLLFNGHPDACKPASGQ